MPSPHFETRSFPAKDVFSLCFTTDGLVDWVGGGNTYAPDGTSRPGRIHFAYRFDAATASPCGRMAILYEQLGTKAILIQDRKVVRELNRSFYHADSFRFPVHLFQGPQGRTLLAHCPEEYNQLELDDALTGERLTASESRKPPDYFFSGLCTNPSGSRLASAGWLWHPWNTVEVFDLRDALSDPTALDRPSCETPRVIAASAEESAACWLTDELLLVSSSSEPEEAEAAAGLPEPRLHPNGLAILDVVRGRYVRAFQFDEPLGALMPIGRSLVVALHRHPRLISLDTGEVLNRWDSIPSGDSVGPIGHELGPPIALDPATGRFAVAHDGQITVVTVHSDRA